MSEFSNKPKYNSPKNSKPKNSRQMKFQKTLVVDADNELLKFLYQEMGKNNKIKSYLQHQLVKLNDEIITQYNHPVKKGDKIEINPDTSEEEKRFRDLSIVYEDDDLIVIDKREGLLSISTGKENNRTAFRILSNYIKRDDSSNLLFVVHRLDRETSGLMMFAKNEKTKSLLQDNWHDLVTERAYLAVIPGKPEPWSGSITSYLYESKALIVYSSQDPEKGQQATTHYKIVKGKKEFTLMRVWLETGRKNQIRVHMKDLGHPIIGDKKYGSALNPIGRLGLHAWILNFTHPTTGEEMQFKTAIPKKFNRLV